MNHSTQFEVSYCTDPIFNVNVLKKTTSEKCDVCLMADNNPLRYGEFIEKPCFINQKLRVHYFCLLTGNSILQQGSSDVGIGGFRLRDIITGIAEFELLCCYYCRDPSAAIECAQPGCDRRFHYICGYNNACLTQFVGSFPSYCHQHVPGEFTQPINTKDRDCDICYDTLPQVTDANFNPLAIVRTRCDEQCTEGRAHRECIQRYAYTAGYNFKCPICHSKNFKTHAAESGIFIPERESAWEREPGAYQDVDKRKCIAVPCRLKNTQQGKETKKLIGCKICGGQLMHKVCAGIKEENNYLCNVCKNESFANLE